MVGEESKIDFGQKEEMGKRKGSKTLLGKNLRGFENLEGLTLVAG